MTAPLVLPSEGGILGQSWDKSLPPPVPSKDALITSTGKGAGAFEGDDAGHPFEGLAPTVGWSSSLPPPPIDKDDIEPKNSPTFSDTWSPASSSSYFGPTHPPTSPPSYNRQAQHTSMSSLGPSQTPSDRSYSSLSPHFSWISPSARPDPSQQASGSSSGKRRDVFLHGSNRRRHLPREICDEQPLMGLGLTSMADEHHTSDELSESGPSSSDRKKTLRSMPLAHPQPEHPAFFSPQVGNQFSFTSGRYRSRSCSAPDTTGFASDPCPSHARTQENASQHSRSPSRLRQRRVKEKASGLPSMPPRMEDLEPLQMDPVGSPQVVVSPHPRNSPHFVRRTNSDLSLSVVNAAAVTHDAWERFTRTRNALGPITDQKETLTSAGRQESGGAGGSISLGSFRQQPASSPLATLLHHPRSLTSLRQTPMSPSSSIPEEPSFFSDPLHISPPSEDRSTTAQLSDPRSKDSSTVDSGPVAESSSGNGAFWLLNCSQSSSRPSFSSLGSPTPMTTQSSTNAHKDGSTHSVLNVDDTEEIVLSDERIDAAARRQLNTTTSMRALEAWKREARVLESSGREDNGNLSALSSSASSPALSIRSRRPTILSTRLRGRSENGVATLDGQESHSRFRSPSLGAMRDFPLEAASKHSAAVDHQRSSSANATQLWRATASFASEAASSYRMFVQRSASALTAMSSSKNVSAPQDLSRRSSVQPKLYADGALVRQRAAGFASGAPRGYGGGNTGNLSHSGGGQYAGGQSRSHQGGENGSGGRGQPSGGGGGGGGWDGSGGGGRQPNGGGSAKGSGGGQGSQDVQTLFKRLELVGRGAYGAVYRGMHIASGVAVALKVVNLDTPDDDVSDIQKEVAVLSQLRDAEQKNVVRYWGCWLKGPELWIVMDYAEGGSIRTLMRGGPIVEQHAVIIVRETLVALAYLHKAGIIHRDIKAANILLTNAGKILLCDFGVAASLVSSASKRTTFVGTPYWMSPEVITTGKSYDQSADIWSLGITIYEMVTGNPPLADQEQMRAIMLIPKNKPPRLPAQGKFTALMRDFVATCLNEEPKERPTAEELIRSKWIKSSAKSGTGILKELIAAYTAWTKTGGMRMSLLGAEAADLDPNNRTSFAFDNHDGSGGWEFGTFKGEAFGGAEDPPAALSPSGSIVKDSTSAPAPRRDHPLLRLFQPEGPESADVLVKADDQLASRTGILAKLDPKEIRPAPPPPTLAHDIESEGSPQDHFGPKTLSDSPLIPPVAPFAAGAAATRPSTPNSVDKPAFAGMGVSPFRFGTPTNSVPVEAQIAPSPRQAHTQLPSASEAVEAGSSTSRQSPGKRWAPLPSSDAPVRHQRVGTQSSSDTGEDIMVPKFSGSPAESPTHFGRGQHQHQRTQSSASLASGYSKMGSADSSLLFPAPSSTINQFGLSGLSEGPVRPWMTTPRSRNGSTGSQMSDPSDLPVALARQAGATPGWTPSVVGGGNVYGGVNSDASNALPTTASTTSAGRPPTMPSLLGPRARSGSRSRAGPGGDIGMPPLPTQPMPSNTTAMGRGLQSQSPLTSAAKDHTARLATTSFGPEAAIEVLPPLPHPISDVAIPAPSSTGNLFGMRSRKGSGSMRPSPLGIGTSTHFRRQHGGSDPTVPPVPSSPLLSPSTHNVPGGNIMGGGDRYLPTQQVGMSNTAVATRTGMGSRPGPPIRPIDIAKLQGREEIGVELARIVDDLGVWLDALAASLASPPPSGMY